MIEFLHQIGQTIAKLWAAPNAAAILVGILFQFERIMPGASDVRARTQLLLDSCLTQRGTMLSEFMARFRTQDLFVPQPSSRDPFITYVRETDRYAEHQLSIIRVRRAGLAARGAVGWALLAAVVSFFFALWPSSRVLTPVLGVTALVAQLVAFISMRRVEKHLDELEIHSDFKAVRK